ncbi:cardiolipin synthase [Sphingomonas tabacisoli]|uniref:Cardiolipin synthase n=1 Tax=Sphingomonas tabacisoli TaxID=2249466 RepID=A0ABW4I489_9SPHN
MDYWPYIIAFAHGAVIVRALLLEGRDPYSRAAWVLALLLFPVAAPIAYLLFGEPWVSRNFRRRANDAYLTLARLQSDAGDDETLAALPPCYRAPFETVEHISRFGAVAGNRATLTADSNAAIAAMVADIDAAQHRVHISTYIWLIDRNGLAMVDALVRAARRGVRCRVCADAVGSRQMIASKHWTAMKDAGVALCPSLGVRRDFSLLAVRRIDLRNHRKLLVIDTRIAYVGSQNLADPEFRIKPKFAPWVDIMLRVAGPVAQQNDILFASGWAVEKGENLTGELQEAASVAGGFPAVAFGTGPLSPRGAMSGAFVSLLYAAQREVIITTPYFVPDPPLLAALIGCARRGVKTSLILPRRNDSRVIGAICKALYPQLVDAGVDLFEYRPGLLHSKTVVVDGSLCLLGSSNMDRRSLELNFENNMLFYSADAAAEIRARQLAYLADSDPVDPERVKHRSLPKRLAENILTMAGAIF